MCWSRKGVPGSKRSGEAGTPFLDPAAEPNFRSERAAAWSFGWSAYRGPPKGPPKTMAVGASAEAEAVPSAGQRSFKSQAAGSIPAGRIPETRRFARHHAVAVGAAGRLEFRWRPPETA